MLGEAIVVTNAKPERTEEKKPPHMCYELGRARTSRWVLNTIDKRLQVSKACGIRRGWGSTDGIVFPQLFSLSDPCREEEVMERLHQTF